MYPSTPNREIERLTGWGYFAILNQAKHLKLKKDPALKFKVSEKELTIIRDNYMTTTSNVIAAMIGVEGGTVRRYMRANGWKTPPEVSAEATYSSQRGKTVCTPEQDEIIQQCAMTTPVTQLAEQLGISTTALKNRYRTLGILVPQHIVDTFKQRYKKGEPSPLKGRKQVEYMSPEAIERTKATRFQKGDIPHNAYKSDGALSLRRYHSGKKYWHIRLALGIWVPYHVHLWEQAHGPLTAFDIIVFKDGNHLNCTLENMHLMSRSQWTKQHGPITKLSDENIARWLSFKGRKVDKQLSKEIQDHHPGLIEIKRKQIELNRELKKQTHEKRSNN